MTVALKLFPLSKDQNYCTRSKLPVEILNTHHRESINPQLTVTFVLEPLATPDTLFSGGERVYINTCAP